MGNRYSCDPSACQAATDGSPIGTCTLTRDGVPLALDLHQNTCTLLGGKFGTVPDPCPASGSNVGCFAAVQPYGVGPFGTYTVFNQSRTDKTPGLPPPGQYSVYQCETGACTRTAPAKIPTTGQIPGCVGGGLPPNTTLAVTTVECPGCSKTTPSPACTAAIKDLAGVVPPEAFVVYNNSVDGDGSGGLPAKGQSIMGACGGTGPQSVCTVSQAGPIPSSGKVDNCGANDASKPVSLQPCQTGH